MRSFGRYSNWYDRFYRDKPYATESDYVLNKISAHCREAPITWLDLGCGTGRHAACLRDRGLEVTGVDRSEEMIRQARTAHPDLEFHEGEITSFRLNRQFDVASLLFHVVNYLVDENEPLAAFRNIFHHLTQSGLLVFDFWHTGGVTNSPPRPSSKSITLDGREIHRLGRVNDDRAKSRVVVDYEFRLDRLDGPVIHTETHTMRHFSQDQIEGLLEQAGYRLVRCEGWMTGEPLRWDEWYGLVVAQKNDRGNRP